MRILDRGGLPRQAVGALSYRQLTLVRQARAYDDGYEAGLRDGRQHHTQGVLLLLTAAFGAGSVTMAGLVWLRVAMGW